MTAVHQQIGPGARVRGTTGVDYALGAQLFQGGEGRIFSVVGNPDLYVKIYTRPLDANDIAKLNALVKIKDQRLLLIAAWPTEIVSLGGSIVGIVMPAIKNAKPIHQLYNPQDRRTHFPKATFRNLVAVAANLSRNLAVLHDCGIVVGDLSHTNVLANDKSKVFFIDCDSMQVKGFPCKVGLAEMIAPELQGQKLGARMRTRDEDIFALAVLVHELLYLGRHPYSGGASATIVDAITGGDHALLPANATALTQLTTVALDDVATREIKGLFTQAFTSTSRPPALDWAHALAELFHGLRDCKTWNAMHVHPGRKCIWCRVEASGRPSLFGAVHIPAPVRPPQPVARPRSTRAPRPAPQPVTPSFYQAPTAQPRRNTPSISFNLAPVRAFFATAFQVGAFCFGMFILAMALGASQSRNAWQPPPSYPVEPQETSKERRIREARERKERRLEQEKADRADKRRADKQAREENALIAAAKKAEREKWRASTTVAPAQTYERLPPPAFPPASHPTPRNWRERDHRRRNPLEEIGDGLERLVRGVTRPWERPR